MNAPTPARAALTLGPVLFNWAPERWRDFYFRIADEADVDTVVLGEVVCSKRAPLYGVHLPTVLNRLHAAGKEVVLATLALVMGPRDLELVDQLCAADGLIEANDTSALGALQGRPHVVGPLINVYNEGTLAWLARNGAIRVCLPPELPATSIAALASVPIEREVIAFGRLPLAVSARCYHARAEGLTRATCRFACDGDPDGMAVESLEGQPFVAVNGMQTLSHGCCNLLAEVDELRASGVHRLRLSPQSCDMVAVAELFRARLDDRLAAHEASERLAELVGDLPFTNGFYHGREGRSWVDAGA
ncbi:MAG: ubiquinone anaerobic biosynthesis protein UbiV [Pseudomonadota bacterium]